MVLTATWQHKKVPANKQVRERKIVIKIQNNYNIDIIILYCDPEYAIWYIN